ncbi:MAG: hypothetical protein ISR82_01045 [Candidatus Marinimicrobia bacterium]|nr:hypothetical protein [Candidatus Neomarinimicrobiota bacterium]MBL7009792.1 hypothetical protein [Candidatus Neomarinimicrobiota bacterium]
MNPVIQSALIPGWGQKSLQYPKRSRLFTYVESGLLISILGTTTYSNILKKNYIAFAVEHAAVSSSGKSHKYWVDIGNFSSIEDYNDEHLRNREMDDIYEANLRWSWDWDKDSNRNSFEKKRILSDQMKQVATFGVGAIVLNHMVSAIDALYLKRIGGKQNLTVQPWIPLESGGMGYALTLHF